MMYQRICETRTRIEQFCLDTNVPKFLGDNIKYMSLYVIHTGVSYIVYRWISGELGWERRTKGRVTNFNDTVSLMIYALFLFILAGYDKMVTDWKRFSLMTVVSYITMFIFGGIGELEFMRTSLVTAKEWSIEAYLIYGAVLCMVIMYFIHLFRYLHKDGRKLNTCIKMLVPISYFCVAYIVYNGAKGYVFHPHHWWLFYMLAYMTNHDTWPIVYFSGVCTGIYIQGIAQYGPDSILMQKIH